VEKLALDKLEAVRDAVGPEVEVIVECHGRLTPA
jgi:L-alanine-DL-glutamate epimerase-like enolase superfamily enzyme